MAQKIQSDTKICGHSHSIWKEAVLCLDQLHQQKDTQEPLQKYARIMRNGVYYNCVWCVEDVNDK